MRKLFEDSDHDATAAAIRDLFKELGGNVPTRVLAREVIDRDLLTPEELDRCAFHQVQKMCRDALRSLTDERVPFAQPTGGGRNDPWLQLDLFTYTEFTALLDRRAKAIEDDHQILRNLQDWCLRKFGRAPEIPHLSVPTEAL